MSIGIQYCFSSEKRALLDLGLAIRPKYWNKRRACISDNLSEIYGSSSELNQMLSHELRKAEDIISLAFKRQENPLEFFKLYYKPDSSFETVLYELQNRDKEKTLDDIYLNNDIYFQIDNYIKTKTKKVSADMPRIYRDMKDHLFAFEQFRKKPITFDSPDINFYEEFVDFLTYDFVLARRMENFVLLFTLEIS